MVAWAAQRIPAQRPWPSRETDVELEPACRLDGVVRHEGRPVAGARMVMKASRLDRDLWEYEREVEPRGVLEALTDQTGHFVLDRLSPGRRSLAALSGNLAVQEWVEIVGECQHKPVELSLEAGGSIVIDFIDEAGAPVAGASFSVHQFDLATAFANSESSKSSEAGRASLPGLPATSYAYDVEVHPPRGYHAPERPRVSVSAGKETRLRYRFQKAASVTGRVLDEQRRPVPNALVFAVDPHDPETGGAGSRPEEEAHCDTEGRFALEHLLPGSVQLGVTADGFVAWEEQLAAPGEKEIILSRGASVEVEVVDSRAQPFADAKVIAVGPGDDGGELSVICGVCQTDERGRCALPALKDGKYRVSAQQVEPPSEGPRGPNRTVATDAQLVAPGVVKVRLQFDEGLSIVGKVSEQDSGKPVAGARVEAFEEHADPPVDPSDYPNEHATSGGFAISDAAGAFVVAHLRAGRHELNWSAKDCFQADPSVSAQAGDKGLVLKLECKHERTTHVRGHVVDEQGNAVPQIEIDARRILSFGGGKISVEGEALSKKLDSPGGRFEQDVSSSPVQLFAPGFLPAVFDIDLGKSEIDLGDVVLSRGHPLTVQVIEAGTSAPVPGVQLTLSSQCARNSELHLDHANTDAAGSATFEHVPDCPLEITTLSDSHLPAQAIVPKSTTAVTVTLDSGASIEGCILGADGKRMPGISVTAEPVPPTGADQRSTTTDTDGCFALRGLYARPYRVTLAAPHSPEHPLATLQVDIPASGHAHLDHRLKAAPP
jgi:protocatechuate 3,4-dioxygenase beta subunit